MFVNRVPQSKALLDQRFFSKLRTCFHSFGWGLRELSVLKCDNDIDCFWSITAAVQVMSMCAIQSWWSLAGEGRG